MEPTPLRTDSPVSDTPRATAAPPSVDHDVVVELREQRHDTLRNFALLQALAGLLWLVFVSWHQQVGLATLPTYIVWAGALAAHQLGTRRSSYERPKTVRRRYHLGCVVLLGSYVLGMVVAGISYPLPTVAMSALVVVVAANALLAPWASLTASALAWLLTSLAWAAFTDEPFWGVVGGGDLGLFALVWSACFVAGLPLRRSVESAVGGWAQARQALREVQERRGELYRVVRALEEATYRIERTNNELFISRAQAESARAFKARFAATVSHEMRGPLNLLLGFSRMMALYPEKYGEPLPDAYLADVDAIHRNCEHLVALVDDVLDLSQIEADSLPLVKSRIDLRDEVIDQVVPAAKALIERKGLYLNIDVAEPLPPLLADAVRVRQVLLNVLTNAIRFTQRGGITVRVWVEGQAVVTAVRDTGPGIAAQDLPRLFKEFSQVLSTETREGAGSGLGLAISKQLVELHGGSMWVESEPGSGTTFFFSLPMPRNGQEGAQGPSTGRQRQPTLQNACVVVHDEPNFVRLLARYLGDYRIIGIPAPTDLAELVTDAHPRAIITTDDWREQVLTQLAGTGYSVPIISAMVPHASTVHQSRGIVGYLVKPISPEMLWSVMKHYEAGDVTQVLVVDDDPDAVRLMRDMLTVLPHAYQIHSANSGAQALELMETVLPDIVFMDLMMPGMTGEETVDRMRQQERLRAVPVVIVSAQDASDAEVQVETPLRLDLADPLRFAEANAIIKALLGCVSPRYLPASPPAQSPPTDHAR